MSRSAMSRRVAVPLAVVVAALAAGGCSADPAPAPPPSGPPTADMRVGLVEWGFTMSASTLRAGPVRLTVTNAGSTAHDLEVLDGHTVLGKTASLSPGAGQTLEIDLSGHSEVTFLCTLPGHRAQGMVREVRVVPPRAVSSTQGATNT
ncbi:hypothetical protein ACFSL4_15550 [Streptomyces caeni]|uniref:EfeO-type cupredoxin-like domain-containing protein n=1 Tax=Streptomyces caeni TaxID=2307231 RepID=A0ABW4ISV2_9ACTN